MKVNHTNYPKDWKTDCQVVSWTDSPEVEAWWKGNIYPISEKRLIDPVLYKSCRRLC